LSKRWRPRTQPTTDTTVSLGSAPSFVQSSAATSVALWRRSCSIRSLRVRRIARRTARKVARPKATRMTIAERSQ
jgi:hypothetical protein